MEDGLHLAMSEHVPLLFCLLLPLGLDGLRVYPTHSRRGVVFSVYCKAPACPRVLNLTVQQIAVVYLVTGNANPPTIFLRGLIK